MTKRGEIASETEIETARKLLEDVILGIAYWLKHGSEAFESNLDNDAAKLRLSEHRNAFKVMTAEGVVVPVAPSEKELSLLKVRMIKFYDVSNTEHHPAPDPLLLAVKAATIWSRRHNQPLKVVTEPLDEDECEEEEEELSVLAEVQFLERRRNALSVADWG